MESRFFFKTFLRAVVFFFLTISFAFSYEVILKNGKTVSGKLVAENEQSIVLQDASGTQISLKKINVDIPKTNAANRNEAAPLSVGIQPSNGSNHQSSEPSVDSSDTKGNEVMTNQTVIDLFTAKTGDSVIISLIKHSSTKFDLSPTAILQLKKVGLSDPVIEAMIDTEGTAATQAPAVTDAGNVGLPKDIGVYLHKDNGWVEIDPEVVNWQTGGVMKHVFSAGIVKQDLNGQIRGPHCGNAIEIPAEVRPHKHRGQV